ncbi:uncharacterized protein PSFLO_05140 [Pseudozyma flocculosa]|nr:uncharacterized protein PSFLO_05140 [Pseudozyma flocculosa]
MSSSISHHRPDQQAQSTTVPASSSPSRSQQAGTRTAGAPHAVKRKAPRSYETSDDGYKSRETDEKSRESDEKSQKTDDKSGATDNQSHGATDDEEYEEIAMNEIRQSAFFILDHASRRPGPGPTGSDSMHSLRSSQVEDPDWAAIPEKAFVGRGSALHCEHCGSSTHLTLGRTPSMASLANSGNERAAFEQSRQQAATSATALLGTEQEGEDRRRGWPSPPLQAHLRASVTANSTDMHSGDARDGTLSGHGHDHGHPTLPPEDTWQPVMALMASLQALVQPDPAVARSPPLTTRPATQLRLWKPLPPPPPTEVTFGRNDPANPQTWSKTQRWFITALMGAAMVNATLASTIANGAMTELAPALGLGPTERLLVTTLFVGGCVAGPILWAPLSELWGRRPTFLLSTAVYALFQIGCARSRGKATLLACRFFSGAFASSALTNAGGVITDLFPPMERGAPMIVFSGSPFLGPVLGPLIGGAVVAVGSWPSVFWLLFIVGSLLEVALLLALPETYAPLILTRIAHKRRRYDPRWYGPLDRMDKTFRSLVTVNLARPLVMVCTEPILASATIFMSYLFALLYIFFVSWPAIFGAGGIYGFGAVSTGLSYLPMGVGCGIAAACIPFFNRLYIQACQRERKPCPEERLVSIYPVAPCVAIGFLWAGWSASSGVHWIVPMLAGALIGFGMVLAFQGWLTYLGDCYRSYAASAVAGTVIVRSVAGATLPLVVSRLLSALGGVGWLYTLLAGLALLLTPLPFVFAR